MRPSSGGSRRISKRCLAGLGLRRDFDREAGDRHGGGAGPARCGGGAGGDAPRRLRYAAARVTPRFCTASAPALAAAAIVGARSGGAVRRRRGLAQQARRAVLLEFAGAACRRWLRACPSLPASICRHRRPAASAAPAAAAAAASACASACAPVCGLHRGFGAPAACAPAGAAMRRARRHPRRRDRRRRSRRRRRRSAATGCTAATGAAGAVIDRRRGDRRSAPSSAAAVSRVGFGSASASADLGGRAALGLRVVGGIGVLGARRRLGRCACRRLVARLAHGRLAGVGVGAAVVGSAWLASARSARSGRSAGIGAGGCGSDAGARCRAASANGVGRPGVVGLRMAAGVRRHGGGTAGRCGFGRDAAARTDLICDQQRLRFRFAIDGPSGFRNIIMY